MQPKLYYSIIGYGFLGLNIYSLSLGYPRPGIIFGMVAMLFFIKALRTKVE